RGGIRLRQRGPGPVRTGRQSERGEDRGPLAGRAHAAGNRRVRRPHHRSDRGRQAVIWKCAIAVLLCAASLFGDNSASPGYAAYQKANALLVAKKLPEAVAAVDEALRLDPKLVPALTLKAKLAMAASRLDVARRCLEQALSIDPRSQYAQFLYGLEAF